MGKHNKEKCNRKHKKSLKLHKRCSRSDSSSSVEEIKRKSKTKSYSTKNNESESDEWVECDKIEDKVTEKLKEQKRDEWFSLDEDFKLTSNVDKQKRREEKIQADREKDTYNPSTNIRELNPYWKSGEGGLPSFQKPRADFEQQRNYKQKYQSRERNWRNTPVYKNDNQSVYNKDIPSTSSRPEPKKLMIENDEADIVVIEDLNIIAAKLMKAEIMGNGKLADELKIKLERARANVGKKSLEHEVILTRTDSKGYTQPLKSKLDREASSNSKKNKKQRTETHSNGERVRYFPDDDKYSLKQMFESEKFNSIDEQNRQFLKLSGKVRKNDDNLDDIFTDNIREKESSIKIEKRDTDRAIYEYKKLSERLDSCSSCLQSDAMLNHLMISAGENMYVSLPSYEPLTGGHCFIIPLKHTACATQLDENEWNELMDYRRALVKMYGQEGEDVVFVETAIGLHRQPHMKIECIPMPKSVGDLAPIYFKKAIDESEKEWTCNKKLISLRGRNVRKAVPKGLPYFSVSFGVDDEGFAHVIEDENDFPRNFAQEIIGGMLDMHHSKWRKPRKQKFGEQSERVDKFSKQWKTFNPTRE